MLSRYNFIHFFDLIYTPFALSFRSVYLKENDEKANNYKLWGHYKMVCRYCFMSKFFFQEFSTVCIWYPTGNFVKEPSDHNKNKVSTGWQTSLCTPVAVGYGLYWKHTEWTVSRGLCPGVKAKGGLADEAAANDTSGHTSFFSSSSSSFFFFFT